MLNARNRRSHQLLALRLSAPALAARAASAVLLAFALGGCRNAMRAMGTTAATFDANTEQAFNALAVRYTQVSRDPRYDRARLQIARTAFTPSRAFDDTSLWTSQPSAVVRELGVQGTFVGGRYVLGAHPQVPRPARPGDSRHIVTLARSSSNEFTWDTTVEFALGAVKAADVAALVAALLASPEERNEATLRGDYAATAPRAAAVLSSLLSIDSLRATPLHDGTTTVLLAVGIHTDELKKRYPAFAQYVAKYVDPSKYRVVLTDRGGAAWFVVAGGDRRIEVHYRLAHGELAPMIGPPRVRPDTLEMHMDFSTKMKMFTVGFTDLVTDLVVTASPHESAWTFVARREPSWKLPLVTAHLLRTPLRHPFEGPGVIFHVGVRDSAEAQTVIERRSHLAVQESAIVRFVGALGSRAVSDLSDRAEREQEVFLRELFTALQADAHALVPSFGSLAGEKGNAAEH